MPAKSSIHNPCILHSVRWLTAFLVMLFGYADLFGDEPAVIKRWEFHSADDMAGWQNPHDLKDVSVTNHRLRMTISGPDAYIFAPPVEVPLDGCVVRICLRCDRSGNTQVYWATNDAAHFSEQQVLHKNTPASSPLTDTHRPDGFIVADYPIGKPSDAGRKLTAFRIDPFNGNNTGTVEIEYVELFRRPPTIDAHISPSTHWCALNEKTSCRVSFKQHSGMAVVEPYAATIAGNDQQQLTISPTGKSTISNDIQFDRPGVHQVPVHAQSSTGRQKYDLETTVIVGKDAQLPVISAISSKRVRLEFIPTPDGKHVGAARWQIAEQNQWKSAGWLSPLVQLTFLKNNGHIVQRQPMMTLEQHSANSVRLNSAITDSGGWQAELELKITETNGLETVAVTAKLIGPENGQLLEFSGPQLRVDTPDENDPLNRFGLFGGLEFLEPGWESSSKRAVGELFAERWSPHPFKVAIPVMAIESAGVTSAIMWQPLNKWDGTEAMPTAVFASPNFLDDQPNHLMKLCVPTIPRWSDENRLYARKPYNVSKNQPLTLQHTLYAEPNLPVAMTCRRWYEIFGRPPHAPPPHDDQTTYNLLARHYGETMYWPKEKGWRNHWYLGSRSGFLGFMAAALIGHALDTGDQQWIERTGLTKHTIIDSLGTLAAQLNNNGPAEAKIKSMSSDGTWPFVNTKQMKELTLKVTQGKYDSLGEDGTTSLGTCVQAALPILRYAHLSGDKKYIVASIKALETMKRFRVPRGAQVWEVHQNIPDIRAAALAVEAYRIGYHLTNDPRWLDEASYWAWTGVPFLYSWLVPVDKNPGYVFASPASEDIKNRVQHPLGEAFENPHRQVMPYATVPVLGTTCYVINWFGVIVQWCGLEWALKVIELDADRPDPLLRHIADGVVISGQQQTFDRPPWIGLYPDVWDTQGNLATGAFICAHLPMRCMQAQGRLPNRTQPWIRVLRHADVTGQWHVSGWGRPVKLSSPTSTGPWSATIDFPAGQPNELILAWTQEPKNVQAAGETLKSDTARTASSTTSGWKYNPEKRATVIRFLQKEKHTEVLINF